MDTEQLVQQLLAQGESVESLAVAVGASASAVTRWVNGNSRPRPEMERALRILLETTNFQNTAPIRAQRSLSLALGKMREAFHRRGRFSSRNEALDELAKLLFAHSVAVRNGETGIGRDLVQGQPGDAAGTLQRFVAEMVNRYLPTSLAHEFDPDDFALRLRPSESALAMELVDAFEEFSSGTASLDSSETILGDLINDAFGQFIIDSFTDEKELGQYLTPSEVVKFMVNLAIDDMTDDEIKALSSPDGFQDFGSVMDPSCGVGSFLAEFIRTMHSRLEESESPPSDWSASASRDLVVGVDKSERMIRLALANLATFGATSARLMLGNSLARRGADSVPLNALEGKVGLILTNPPFGARFGADEISDYKIATDWSNKPGSVDSELLFLERYIDWLRPGGQLIAVVPDSVLTNRGLFANLRKGLAPEIEIRTVISLPTVTFAAAGTSTKTSILHLRKGKQANSGVRFAVCDDIGYSVATRGSQRRKIHSGPGDLPTIRGELRSGGGSLVELVPDIDEAGRWDAHFHASPSSAAIDRARTFGKILRVGDVAVLSDERLNPVRFPDDEFLYVEISDVDGTRMTIDAKKVPTYAAPGRARLVIRSGDVLVSTVRPERGTIGVVPEELDGAICTTGFGVLRPHSIHPVLLAALLRTDFVRDQFLKNNVGIAYPTIEASGLTDIVLPVASNDLGNLQKVASDYLAAVSLAETARRSFQEAVDYSVSAWGDMFQ